MKIAILLSGGVDSTVALHRLRQAGHRDITAFYLKIWLEDEVAYLGHCPWEEDLRFAREACAQAEVPLEVLPLQREYQTRIVEYALDELRAGRTPSSDVLCNRRIKFGAFLETVGERFDKVASGHYARIEPSGKLFRLHRNPDPVKDQTYFLSRLRQEQLARCLFPLGGLHKAEVRELARELDVPNRDRPDSQGICFLGKVPYREFVRHHLGERPGEIRDVATGARLGEHRGLWFHTIGQRRGLRLSGGPWYVTAKDPEHNLLLVSHGERLETVSRDRFQVDALHWIAEPPQREELTVKVRHGEAAHPCTFEAHESGATIRLRTPDPGLAGGQFAVFYDGTVCLGSGVIREAA